MNIINKSRIVLFFIIYSFLEIEKNIINFFKYIVKKSYFKVVNDITMNSPNVNFKACLGKKVWIDKNVVIFDTVKIGDYTCINKNAHIESGNIGKFCSIAANVSIGLGEHPINHLSTHVATYENLSFGLISKSKEYKQKKTKPVIGNDVWIARGVVIMRGVNIGNGAIIGANSVVTKDVPPYSIIAGNPARVIKYRFSDDIIEKLEELMWWDKEDFYRNKFEIYGLGVEDYIKEKEI